jgi:hypothetical protein
MKVPVYDELGITLIKMKHDLAQRITPTEGMPLIISMQQSYMSMRQFSILEARVVNTVFYFEKKYGTQPLTAGKIYNALCLPTRNKKGGVIFFSCRNKNRKTKYFFF